MKTKLSKTNLPEYKRKKPADLLALNFSINFHIFKIDSNYYSLFDSEMLQPYIVGSKELIENKILEILKTVDKNYLNKVNIFTYYYYPHGFIKMSIVFSQKINDFIKENINVKK